MYEKPKKRQYIYVKNVNACCKLFRFIVVVIKMSENCHGKHARRTQGNRYIEIIAFAMAIIGSQKILIYRTYYFISHIKAHANS